MLKVVSRIRHIHIRSLSVFILRHIVCCLVLSFIGALVGCVSVRTHTTQSTYNQATPAARQALAIQINDWDIRGAFSIVRNQKALLANYQWQQSGPQFIIHIAGALNIAATTILGRPGHVTLRQSATKVFHANSAELLMKQQLGWYVPMSYLKYWIRGLYAPGKYKAKFDQFGHIIQLSQQGWSINFSKYQTVQGVDLPKMLRLSRQGLQVKLVVKQWQIN